MTRLFALAAAVLLLAGCTNDALVDQARTLSPGDFLEVNLSMEADDRITVTIEASEPIHWDLHTHGDHNVTVLQEGNGTSISIQHDPSEPGDVSLMVQNQGDAASEVHVTVEGQATVRSVLP